MATSWNATGECSVGGEKIFHQVRMFGSLPFRLADQTVAEGDWTCSRSGASPSLVYAKLDCEGLILGKRSVMSAQRFQGKVAVVTGGNSGIGLGVAKAYAREGAQVAITGRNQKTLEVAAKEIGDGTLAIQSDAGKVAEIEAAMKKINERLGRIDALFVNAGVAKLVRFEEVTEEFFDQTVDINMKGVFFTVQKAIPLMPNGSAIVLNASINAHLGLPGTTVYGATKAAVINMAKTLSADLLEKGIRVNAISPGPITSSLLARDGITEEKLQETKDWIQSKVPIKHFGTPEDIAAGVLYLTAPESAFVLGAELIIDGGMSTL